METIWGVVREEFAEIGDVEQLTRFTLRILIAALLGGVLGYEREQQGQAAGIRTHMLVSLGAALFVLVPQFAGISDEGTSRILQGITSGIGFLGAGTILKTQQKEEVKGLTTAANIWLTAAIGVSVGLGKEAFAVLATILAMIILALIPKLIKS